MSRKILVVDDEQAALNRLSRSIYEAEPDCEIIGFTDPIEAIENIKERQIQPDVAFLDIRMYHITGIELAKRLRDISPNTKIIFVTAYSQYALEAFAVHARGYLLKPATVERVRDELDNLKELSAQSNSRIQVHTFGNFDVFVDGEPVYFHRSRSKEILAYLVDRNGMTITKKEIASIIWEDGEYSRNRQFQLQTLLSEMIRALKEVGAEKMVRKYYNSYSVDPSQFTCDYYRFMKGDIYAVNAYCGEYMANYSWAELTIGSLEKRKGLSP